MCYFLKDKLLHEENDLEKFELHKQFFQFFYLHSH